MTPWASWDLPIKTVNVCCLRQITLTEIYTRNHLYGHHSRENAKEHLFFVCLSFFHGECVAPVTASSQKSSSPLQLVLSWQARAVYAQPNPTCTPHLSKFYFPCLTLFILLLEVFLCMSLLLLPSHPYCSPTACWAGTAIPCKECREEKHSLILLRTVSCTTFDHRQRLSHSWIGPKGRNNSRKTTLLAGSKASRTPQSLPPHLQLLADLAKGGIQLLASVVSIKCIYSSLDQCFKMFHVILVQGQAFKIKRKLWL